MKVALVHELLTIRGGAERVLRELAAMFPDAPIYTLLYDEKKLGDWFPASRVRTSRLQKYANFSTNHHLHLNRFPGAAEAWDFSGFDLVISSSSAFAHGIITNGKPKHLCYVHSPARYLWDRTHDVLNQAGRGPLGFFRRRYLEKLFHNLRIWDSEAADRPDLLLAASKTVQRRIELYWRRESSVLYPPIDDFWFTNPQSAIRNSQSDAPYLIVSTLAPYKRIDLAIDACNQLGRTLIIAGEGPDLRRLKSLAGSTVTFSGYKEGDELRALYATARAVIFPGEEDFGLVPLESLACGTPVIAYGKGGALETLDASAAEFFPEPTALSLIEAIRNFEKREWNPAALRARAQNFSTQTFRTGIEAAVQQTLALP